MPFLNVRCEFCSPVHPGKRPQSIYRWDKKEIDTSTPCTLFKNETQYYKHLSLKHFSEELKQKMSTEPPFKCPDCDKTWKKHATKGFLQHYGALHKAVEKYLPNRKSVFHSYTYVPYRCKICSFYGYPTYFKNLRSLNIHCCEEHWPKYKNFRNIPDVPKCPTCPNKEKLCGLYKIHILNSHDIFRDMKGKSAKKPWWLPKKAKKKRHRKAMKV